MPTSNRVDWQTLGSQPVMSKNLPRHWYTDTSLIWHSLKQHFEISYTLVTHSNSVSHFWHPKAVRLKRSGMHHHYQRGKDPRSPADSRHWFPELRWMPDPSKLGCRIFVTLRICQGSIQLAAFWELVWFTGSSFHEVYNWFYYPTCAFFIAQVRGFDDS